MFRGVEIFFYVLFFFHVISDILPACWGSFVVCMKNTLRFGKKEPVRQSYASNTGKKQSPLSLHVPLYVLLAYLINQNNEICKPSTSDKSSYVKYQIHITNEEISFVSFTPRVFTFFTDNLSVHIFFSKPF